MIDLRLYRLAFAARPARGDRRSCSRSRRARRRSSRRRRRRPSTATRRGRALARIVELAPDRDAGQRGRSPRSPTSVAERFDEIAAGAVTEQSFEGSVDGDDVELRNVVADPPGRRRRDDRRSSPARDSATRRRRGVERRCDRDPDRARERARRRQPREDARASPRPSGSAGRRRRASASSSTGYPTATRSRP